MVIWGCNIFEPRTAEEPVGKVEWNYFPIIADQTLENLVFAYDYKENSGRYGSVLSNDFRFYFDSQDIQDYSLPVYWDKSAEINMRELIDIGIRVNLENIPDKEDIIQAEQAIYNRNYSVYATNRFFSGSMTIFVRREDDGFWRIYRWEDYRKDDNDTWGRLKYEYGS